MFRVLTKLTTTKGSLVTGRVLSEKEVKSLLSKDEIAEQIELGNLVKIVVESVDAPKTKETEVVNIEKLVEVEEKSSLTVAELRRVAEHYKIDETGKKDILLENIAKFEEILDTTELETLSDDELDAMARYMDVSLDLSREEKELALAI